MCTLQDEGVGVGTDPEVFAVDDDGNYRSLIGKLGGSKDNPMPTKHGFVQEDNVAGEFNIHAAFSEDEFTSSVLNVMGDIQEILQPLNLKIDISPIALFPEEELQHAMAQIAGCDPDYDAWLLRTNSPPDLSATCKRSAGGHIHISWDKVNEDPLHRAYLARAMDITAGVPSILMDDNVERRDLYGKAGCHRIKQQANGDAFDGIEYRSLSNFWVGSEATIRWAYNTVRQAVARFTEFKERMDDGDIDPDRIINIINTSDKADAEAFCHQYGIAVGG